MTVRLACADAPDLKPAPDGLAVSQRLKQLSPNGQRVALRVVDVDRYKHAMAEVYVSSTTINLQRPARNRLALPALSYCPHIL